MPTSSSPASSAWALSVVAGCICYRPRNCPGSLVRAGRRISTEMEEGLGHTQSRGEGQEQGQGE